MAATWDQTPEYQAAANRQPGRTTQYTVSPQINPMNHEDVTSFHPGQANWSRDNMPDIMYVLKAPPLRATFRGRPDQKSDADDKPVFEANPREGVPARPIVDFEVLPDIIGSHEESWRIEAWRRYDPRIEYADILMRQKFRQHDTRGEVWEVNRLQMRMRRNRSSFFQLCWDTRPNGGQSEQSRVLALIPGINQDSNSTRGLTPGMIDPARGENGGRVPAPRPERIRGQRADGQQAALQIQPHTFQAAPGPLFTPASSTEGTPRSITSFAPTSIAPTSIAPTSIAPTSTTPGQIAVPALAPIPPHAAAHNSQTEATNSQAEAVDASTPPTNGQTTPINGNGVKYPFEFPMNIIIKRPASSEGSSPAPPDGTTPTPGTGRDTRNKRHTTMSADGSERGSKKGRKSASRKSLAEYEEKPLKQTKKKNGVRSTSNTADTSMASKPSTTDQEDNMEVDTYGATDQLSETLAKRDTKGRKSGKPKGKAKQTPKGPGGPGASSVSHILALPTVRQGGDETDSSDDEKLANDMSFVISQAMTSALQIGTPSQDDEVEDAEDPPKTNEKRTSGGRRKSGRKTR